MKPGRLRDLGPGQGHVVAQLAQHQREVRPAQRGGTRRRSAAPGAEVERAVRHAYHPSLFVSEIN
jgi:hypothetical protein